MNYTLAEGTTDKRRGNTDWAELERQRHDTAITTLVFHNLNALWRAKVDEGRNATA